MNIYLLIITYSQQHLSRTALAAIEHHDFSWFLLFACYFLQVLFAAVLMLMVMSVGRRCCFQLTINCANAAVTATAAMLCHSSFSASCDTLSSSLDMPLWLCGDVVGGSVAIVIMLWTNCCCCVICCVFSMRVDANLRILQDCWLHGPDRHVRR